MNKITQSITEGVSRFFGNAGESFSTWAVNFTQKISRRRLLKKYRGLVYTCVNAIAEDVAKYQPVFNKRDNRTGKLTPSNHEFAKVLENPNPALSKFDLFVGTQAFIELTGDAFWYYSVEERSRKVREIYLMRPDRVEVAVEDGEVIGYAFKQDNGTKIPLEPDEVEHLHTFNPENPFRGIGTVEAALLYAEMEEDTSTFQSNFMKNQATPSGVLTIKGKISPEAFKKVKTQWKEKQSGLANAGKTLFIREADASFTKIGLSLGDIDMAALKQITEDKLFKMFRIPKFLLGDFDQTGLGRSNIEAGDYVFAKRVIDPKQIRIDDAIQKTLRRNYKDQVTVVGHVSQIPQDAAAQLNEDDKAVGRWETINEVRERRGLPKVNGGDNLYVAFNQVPIDESNTGNDNGGDDSDKSAKVIRRLVVRKDTAEETFFKQLNRIDDRTRRSYKAQNNKFLEDQRKGVIDNLAAVANSKRDITKAYEEILPDAEEEASKADEVLAGLLLLGLVKAGETAFEFLDNGEEFTVAEGLRRLMQTRTHRVIKDHTAQTITKLQKTIAAGVANSENIKKLTARVNKVYSQAKTHRARTLSENESHKWVNKGLQEAYKQSGIKKKEWRALGDNPCEYCLAMNGTIIEIDEVFVPKGDSIEGEDGGEYVEDYEEVENANAHPNCHCWLFPVKG